VHVAINLTLGNQKNVIFKAFLCVFDFNGMAIITAIMGFLRTWVHVPLPLVFAEYLSQER
jgi:hypothetical protein